MLAIILSRIFKRSMSCFGAKTLEAECFYQQQRLSVVFSVWEPKAAALQVNLPVWSQTGCTLGQSRGDYTCIWVNTVCACVYDVLQLAQEPLKSALQTPDSIAQYYNFWDLSHARMERMDFRCLPCNNVSTANANPFSLTIAGWSTGKEECFPCDLTCYDIYICFFLFPVASPSHSSNISTGTNCFGVISSAIEYLDCFSSGLTAHIYSTYVQRG